MPPHPDGVSRRLPIAVLRATMARFDNRHSTSAPTPTLTAVSGSGASGTSESLNRQQCHPPHQFMRECSTAKFALDPPRAKGSLNHRFEWFSLVHFLSSRKKQRSAYCCRARELFVCGKYARSPRSRPRSAQRLFAAARAFPHVTGVFLIVVGPPTVPAQLSAAAACYYGKNYSFCRIAG